MTTATVPLAAAEILLTGADLDDAVRCSVSLGSCPEVDVVRLETCRHGLGARLWRYWAATLDLWQDYNDGREVSGVSVRVPLTAAQQKDSAEGRTDLREELAAIENLADLEGVATLLDGTPDWEAVAATGTLERNGNRSRLECTVSGGFWPLQLGGPRRPGETARRVTVEASHASWRDRRVRRLMSVQVDAIEVWPDPRGF